MKLHFVLTSLKKKKLLTQLQASSKEPRQNKSLIFVEPCLAVFRRNLSVFRDHSERTPNRAKQNLIIMFFCPIVGS